MRDQLLDILRGEVKPALGCTGPISVAFAASAATDAVGGTPRRLRIVVDKDTYKNSISVATPGTPYFGVLKPAVVGALYGKSEYGLEVIRDLRGFDRAAVDEFARSSCEVEIAWDLKVMGVYIEAWAWTDRGVGHVIVAKEHDRIVLQEADGVVLRREEGYSPDDAGFEENRPIRSYAMADIYEFARDVEIGKIAFLKEALDANLRLATAGLDEGLGAKFGSGFLGMKGDEVYLRAKALAAGASDARMAGKELPAMSCAGSGNVGITASVPLIAVAEGYGKSEEELLRAVALSYLLTVLGKAHIGRLSPMCACAMVASIGVGAGTCMLLGGSFCQIEYAIANIVGSTGGVLCDGAKFGCALKLSTATGVAIESALLALSDIRIPAYDGLVGASGDETLALLGRIASKGMLSTDEYMAREFIERERSRGDR